MKRVVIVVAGVIFLLLAGCEMDNSPQARATAVHASVTDSLASMTALYTTPSQTSTPTPDGSSLVSLLNNNINNDELSEAIDAHYKVMDVAFVGTMEMMFNDFIIYVDCECVNGKACCTPERSAVTVIHALVKIKEDLADSLPGNLVEVHVVCTDHLRPIGTVSVSWLDLSQYLYSGLSGYQLGNRIRVTPIP